MRAATKIASRLFVFVGLLTALFASPALAAGFVLNGTIADFHGVWDTVIPEVNARYRVYMQNMGDTIQGTMENKQAPQYSGQFTGYYENGRLYFSYVQPAVGASGNGEFSLGSDGRLSGVVWATGEQNIKTYIWEGTPLPDTVAAHSAPKTNTGGDIRTVGANGTTVYGDQDATTEKGALDPGVKVTVAGCPNWSCQITAPVAGFVDEKDLN